MTTVVQIGALPEPAEAKLRARFDVAAFANEAAAMAEPGILASARGMATTGKAVVGPTLVDALPRLEIISCLGAGTDGIDLDAARLRGIEVATTSKVLAADVADIAMGLILGTARDLAGADRFVRAGAWEGGRFPLGRSVNGARLGIVGLGAIGSALARRAAAFDMEIAYHSRNVVRGSPHRHVSQLDELAGWCDFLALCCPGGPATYRLVNAEILRALGPRGILINVARGSVVDEAALAEALASGTIAGAGLDVFEDEPRPHPMLLESGRVLLLPHIGSATLETRENMAVAMVEALARKLSAS